MRFFRMQYFKSSKLVKDEIEMCESILGNFQSTVKKVKKKDPSLLRDQKNRLKKSGN